MPIFYVEINAKFFLEYPKSLKISEKKEIAELSSHHPAYTVMLGAVALTDLVQDLPLAKKFFTGTLSAEKHGEKLAITVSGCLKVPTSDSLAKEVFLPAAKGKARISFNDVAIGKTTMKMLNSAAQEVSHIEIDTKVSPKKPASAEFSNW